MAAHKVPVTITFRKPGTLPPVFVAGSYSEPQWQQPLEMSYAVDDGGEYTFKAEILADPGSSIQYKFRLGHGDWWALDETVESVTDDQSNRNNVLTVPTAARDQAEGNPTPVRPKDTPSQGSQIIGEGAAPVPANESGPAPEIRLPDGATDNSTPDLLAGSETSSGWIDPFSTRLKSISHMNADDDWDVGQDCVPLFAHECLQSSDQGSLGGGSQPHSPSDSRHHSLGFEHEPDKLDLEDPELEQFPSRLEQISELIHEVEDELDEDETAFEGVPPSAVLGVPRRSTNDFVGDFIAGSPAASPSLSRPTKRLAVPRASMGSATSDVSSSALSLQSIAEGGEEEPDDDDEALLPQPVFSVPNPVSRPKVAFKSPTSEDDEAVVLDSFERVPAEPLAPARPRDGEKTSTSPSAEDPDDDLAGETQKSQAGWIDHNGEPPAPADKDGGAPRPTDAPPPAHKAVMGGPKDGDWQTRLALGGAAFAVLGLALWWKGRAA